MALLFMDGCETGLDGGKWTFSDCAFGSGYARTGSGGMMAASDNSYVEFATKTTTAYVGFAFRVDGAVSSLLSSHIAAIGYDENGDDSYISLTVEGTGAVALERGGAWSGAGTQLAISSAGLILDDTWHYIELKGYIHDTSGVAEVKVDGVVVATFSGDTKFDSQGVDAEWNRIYVGSTDTTPPQWFDDIVIYDSSGTVNNDYLGDVQIEALTPDGNGTTNQFVGSDADSTDNYLLVDEIPPVTTDYTESSTVAERDLYTFSDISVGASQTVVGAMSHAYVVKDDANARGVKMVCVSGATTDVGADNALAESYKVIHEVYEVDPNTSSAWTETNLNAAEFGVEVGS